MRLGSWFHTMYKGTTDTVLVSALAPNGPERWGCRTHVEWEFETYIVKFETYSVKRDYETKKTAGALEPPEPPSLAPMYILHYPQ